MMTSLLLFAECKTTTTTPVMIKSLRQLISNSGRRSISTQGTLFQNVHHDEIHKNEATSGDKGQEITKKQQGVLDILLSDTSRNVKKGVVLTDFMKTTLGKLKVEPSSSQLKPSKVDDKDIQYLTNLQTAKVEGMKKERQRSALLKSVLADVDVLNDKKELPKAQSNGNFKAQKKILLCEEDSTTTDKSTHSSSLPLFQKNRFSKDNFNDNLLAKLSKFSKKQNTKPFDDSDLTKDSLEQDAYGRAISDEHGLTTNPLDDIEDLKRRQEKDWREKEKKVWLQQQEIKLKNKKILDFGSQLKVLLKDRFALENGLSQPSFDKNKNAVAVPPMENEKETKANEIFSLKNIVDESSLPEKSLKEMDNAKTEPTGLNSEFLIKTITELPMASHSKNKNVKKPKRTKANDVLDPHTSNNTGTATIKERFQEFKLHYPSLGPIEFNTELFEMVISIKDTDNILAQIKNIYQTKNFLPGSWNSYFLLSSLIRIEQQLRRQRGNDTFCAEVELQSFAKLLESLFMSGSSFDDRPRIVLHPKETLSNMTLEDENELKHQLVIEEFVKFVNRKMKDKESIISLQDSENNDKYFFIMILRLRQFFIKNCSSLEQLDEIFHKFVDHLPKIFLQFQNIEHLQYLSQQKPVTYLKDNIKNSLWSERNDIETEDSLANGCLALFFDHTLFTIVDHPEDYSKDFINRFVLVEYPKPLNKPKGNLQLQLKWYLHLEKLKMTNSFILEIFLDNLYAQRQLKQAYDLMSKYANPAMELTPRLRCYDLIFNGECRSVEGYASNKGILLNSTFHNWIYLEYKLNRPIITKDMLKMYLYYNCQQINKAEMLSIIDLCELRDWTFDQSMHNSVLQSCLKLKESRIIHDYYGRMVAMEMADFESHSIILFALYRHEQFDKVLEKYHFVASLYRKQQLNPLFDHDDLLEMFHFCQVYAMAAAINLSKFDLLENLFGEHLLARRETLSSTAFPLVQDDAGSLISTNIHYSSIYYSCALRYYILTNDPVAAKTALKQFPVFWGGAFNKEKTLEERHTADRLRVLFELVGSRQYSYSIHNFTFTLDLLECSLYALEMLDDKIAYNIVEKEYARFQPHIKFLKYRSQRSLKEDFDQGAVPPICTHESDVIGMAPKRNQLPIF